MKHIYFSLSYHSHIIAISIIYSINNVYIYIYHYHIRSHFLCFAQNVCFHADPAERAQRPRALAAASGESLPGMLGACCAQAGAAAAPGVGRGVGVGGALAPTSRGKGGGCAASAGSKALAARAIVASRCGRVGRL